MGAMFAGTSSGVGGAEICCCCEGPPGRTLRRADCGGAVPGGPLWLKWICEDEADGGGLAWYCIGVGAPGGAGEAGL
jgi:hypothetical protein